MNIRESIRMAVLDIRVNKMRTLLSMLGIIIGIASVIIIVAIGNGLRYKILDQFSGFGANNIYISGRWDPKTNRSGTITLRDIAELRSIQGVTDITPQINWSTEVKGPKQAQNMEIRGIAEDFFTIAGLTIQVGRGLTSQDLDYRQNVCVIKPAVADILFGTKKESPGKPVEYSGVSPQDVIGKTIKINGIRFTIVGILSTEERSMGYFWSGPNAIFVPATVLLRMTQQKSVPAISVQVADMKQTKKVGRDIIQTLEKRHNSKGGYHLNNPEDIQKEINTALNIFTLVIGSIGGLSLLVGGIGIMNILLASVAERTREIGIRKAIGAKRRDILIQFLIEAGTISGSGGAIGIILGIILAKSIDIVTQNNIPAAILPSSIIIALLFSILVGMFFGIYPASKAANLHPMEALRYE